MRRTSRALSVAALVVGALVTAAPVVSADPDVEVSPSTVSAGGDVSVSLSCDPLGGPAPETLEATSGAFDGGTIELKHVPGDDDELSGPAYTGTGRIAPEEGEEGTEGDPAWTVDGTCPAPPGGQGQPWSATLDVSRGAIGSAPTPAPVKPCTEPYGSEATGTTETTETTEPTEATDTALECLTPTTKPCPPPHGTDPAASTCPTAPAKPCPPPRATQPHESPSYGPKAPRDCAAAVIQRGVRAGEGGSLGGSMPALVLGGLLITGAAGAAVHRVRHRDPAGR
ncbi:hypothetical protein ACGFNV_00860 [Streptomyces sp. NPDC048751]|uniref:hypothetical protein n=1 Tax=Streptomyces sp. NPDC048751 TaxID=3365591 RepID=UPI0037133BBE